MTVLIKKSERPARAFSRAEKIVDPEFIIGVRVNELVRTDEKHFNGIPRTFFARKGNIVKKMLFLFGSGAVKVRFCKEEEWRFVSPSPNFF